MNSTDIAERVRLVRAISDAWRTGDDDAHDEAVRKLREFDDKHATPVRPG